jgi:hypothetical protein
MTMKMMTKLMYNDDDDNDDDIILISNVIIVMMINIIHIHPNFAMITYNLKIIA